MKCKVCEHVLIFALNFLIQFFSSEYIIFCYKNTIKNFFLYKIKISILIYIVQNASSIIPLIYDQFGQIFCKKNDFSTDNSYFFSYNIAVRFG